MAKENKVDVYLEKQPSPQKEICKKLRAIILKTFPGIKEEIKMGVPWYEDKFYIVSLKAHVNLGFALKGLPKVAVEQLEGSGKIMKHIEIRDQKDINEKKIVGLLKLLRNE